MAIAPLGTSVGGNSGTVAATTLTNGVPTAAQGVTDANTIGYWTIYGVGTSIGAIPTPTGWTPVTGTAQISGTTFRSATFFRYASAEPASYSVSGLTSGAYCGLMRFYSGVDGTTDQDVAATNAISTTTTPTPPAITPLTSGAFIDAVNGVVTASGFTTTTWTSSNMTKDLDSTSARTAATNAAGGLAHQAWTSGAFSPNLAPTGTTSRGIALTMAIRPAAAAAAAFPVGQARRVARPPVARRRGRVEVTPSQVVVTAPTKVADVGRHARLGLLVSRRRRPAAVVPPQAVATPPPYVPEARRRAVRALLPRRGHSLGVTPHQAIPPRDVHRRTIRGLMPRRRGRAEVVPPQIVAAPPPWISDTRRRALRGLLGRRRRSVEVTPPQAAAAPPPYVPDRRPPRRAFIAPRRGRSAPVAPPQTVVPQARRRAVRGLVTRRRNRVEVTPPQVAVAPPPYVPDTRRRAVRAFVGRRRRRSTEVTPPQVAVAPPSYVPTIPPKRTLRGIPRRGRRAEIVPAQAAPVAPRYVPAVPPKRVLRGVPRRGRRADVPPAGHLSVAFTGFLERIRQILFSPRPPTVDIAFAPQGNDQRIVTYTEQQRPVAFAPAPPSTTFQEVPMRLSRQGVERYEPGPTTTPPIDPALWLASFDGGLTWVAATVAGGQPTWLVAGPAVASPPAGATKLPDVEWLVPAVKFDNAPETIIRDESFDADQQPPAIYLTG